MTPRVPARIAHAACTPAPDDKESAKVAQLREQPALVIQPRDKGRSFMSRGWGCVICREELTTPVVLVMYGGLG